MTATIVASSTTRHGGWCARCECPIRPGEPIHKLDVGERGYTTTGGNGAGMWVCGACALDLTND